jgi:hypothetical protein
MNGLVKQISRTGQRLISIKDDPSGIANDYALGIFLATTPFIGLKVFISSFSRGLYQELNWLLILIIHGWIRFNLLSRIIRRELKRDQYVFAVK